MNIYINNSINKFVNEFSNIYNKNQLERIRNEINVIVNMATQEGKLEALKEENIRLQYQHQKLNKIREKYNIYD